MDEVDKCLVDFSFNDLKLDIYGRYCDDAFIPWLHVIDNLLNFKQALDEDTNLSSKYYFYCCL